MRVFTHRRDEEYLSVLRERLSIDGKNGLLETAVKIQTPMKHGDKMYTHCCRIDFAGIAATNLFDAGQNIVSNSAADLMEILFSNAKLLNDKGIFVKLRLLFVYPYSTSAITRMQAELSRNRASMKHPLYGRNFQLVESVDEDMFKQSSFVRAQSLTLEQLQEWIEEYSWSTSVSAHEDESVNRAILRFAPLSPNMCLLFVNETIFTDSYLLAKELRETRGLANLAPLVQIDKADTEETFRAFDDHFRYLWDLDVSLYADDATYYQPGKPNSLKVIRTPDKITFDVKAGHIKDKTTYTYEQIQKWQFQVKRLLNRHCRIPAATPASESLFITCSWERGGDGRSRPNKDAQEIFKMLETDVGSIRTDSLLSVHIMEGVAGEFLTRQLYNKLEESSLALILMTGDFKDTEDKYYCKPNIYHELGFLMKHLGNDRTFVIREENTVIPSNIQDLIRENFTKGKLILSYLEVLKWLVRACSFSVHVIQSLLKSHQARLEEAIVKNQISQEAGQEAIGKVQEELDRYND